MKKRKLLDLNVLFNQLLGLGKTKFKLGLLENLEILKPIVVPLRQIEDDNKHILDAFEKERVDLVVKLGTKNPDGSITVNKNDEKAYSEFTDQFQKIIDAHKETLELHNAKLAEWDEILDEEYDQELKFKQFTEDQLPEDGISGEQLMLLIEANVIKR